MAVKKVGGSVKNGRDSIGRRLGIKLNHQQRANAGAIIVRQRGKKYKCGEYTYMSKDHTIHASIDGCVKFFRRSEQVYVSIVAT